MRCSHLFGALVVDHDESLKNVKTYSMYKHEIFEKAKDILNNMIAEYKQNNESDIRAVARSYTDPTVETKPEAEKRFADIYKQRSVDMLNVYIGAITKKQSDELLADILGAI
jgi:hypothetical protein